MARSHSQLSHRATAVKDHSVSLALVRANLTPQPIGAFAPPPSIPVAASITAPKSPLSFAFF